MADYTEAEIYARAMYDALRVDVGTENVPPWEELPENSRESYRRQANHVRAAVCAVPVTEEVGQVFRGPDGTVYLVSPGYTVQPGDMPAGTVELVPAVDERNEHR